MNNFVSFVAYLQNMFIMCLKYQPTSYNKTRNTTKDKVMARVFKLDPSFLTYVITFFVSWILLEKASQILQGLPLGIMLGVSKTPKVAFIGTQA
jgi:hypothetical protein